MEAAAFEDTHVMQSLSSNSNEQELRGKSGANAPPKTQEPNMKKGTEGTSVIEKNGADCLAAAK